MKLRELETVACYVIYNIEMECFHIYKQNWDKEKLRIFWPYQDYDVINASLGNNERSVIENSVIVPARFYGAQEDLPPGKYLNKLDLRWEQSYKLKNYLTLDIDLKEYNISGSMISNAKIDNGIIQKATIKINGELV